MSSGFVKEDGSIDAKKLGETLIKHVVSATQGAYLKMVERQRLASLGIDPDTVIPIKKRKGG